MAGRKSFSSIVLLTLLMLEGVFCGNVYAQRGSLHSGSKVTRSVVKSVKNKKKLFGGHWDIVVPGPPAVIVEDLVPVEVVVVEHPDTLYDTCFYDPDPIKGKFSLLAGVRFSRADVAETFWSDETSFKPGFNLGCRWDLYRLQKDFAAYNSIDMKYQLSHYWVDQTDDYEHHSLHYLDVAYHFGLRWVRSNGDVCSFGFGPFFGISPYGNTKTKYESYSTFADQPFVDRLHWGLDVEAAYTHDHLFVGVAWSRVLNKLKFGETTMKACRSLSVNAGYRF